ncbi:hypothetical protein EDB80DRAFT_96962 [Ilyonectria destructans]|nr:hypothetical protein EDB80DRAFT_96962 [Ilyonectria destructans]
MMTWCAPAFSQVPTWCASENVVINGARWPPYEKYYCTCCDTRGTLFLFLFKRDPRLIVDYRRSAAKAVQDGTSRLTRDPLASDALHSPAAQMLKMHGSWSCSRSTRQCNDEHGIAMATRSVSLHPKFPAPTAQNNDSQNLALSTCNPSVSNIHSHSRHPYKGHNACPSIHPQASRPLTPKAHAANPPRAQRRSEAPITTHPQRVPHANPLALPFPSYPFKFHAWSRLEPQLVARGSHPPLLRLWPGDSSPRWRPYSL